MTVAAPTLWKSTHGRRSLLYLIAPRSRRHFTPAQIAILAETDATKAQTSKKEDSVRAAEIRKAASESLLEFVAKHGKEAAMDTGGSLLVTEIMLQADGGTCFRSFRLSVYVMDAKCRTTTDHLAFIDVVQIRLRLPRPYSN